MERFKALSDSGTGYDEVFRRDPMQPLVDARGNIISSVGLHSGLVVQGIIWSEGSEEARTALVDDEFYVQGDIVGPYRILEIRSDGLFAQSEDKTVFIPLYPEVHAGRNVPSKPTSE